MESKHFSGYMKQLAETDGTTTSDTQTRKNHNNGIIRKASYITFIYIVYSRDLYKSYMDK